MESGLWYIKDIRFSLISQIHLHGKKLESLHRFIPKEALPSEYGGTQQAFDNSTWRREILNDADYFNGLESFHCLNDRSSYSSDSPMTNQTQYVDVDTDDDSERGSNEFFNCAPSPPPSIKRDEQNKT